MGERIANMGSSAGPATPSGNSTTGSKVAASHVAAGSGAAMAMVPSLAVLRSASGQVAVGQVVANRAKSGRFPGSYCGVVFQRSQFSFVRGRALPPIPRASAQWKTAVAVAHIVDNDLHAAVVPKALFFHARYVSPGWKRMTRVASVGNHVFYR